MDNVVTIVVTIVVTALGSSGLWSYLQYRLDKKSKITETLNEIKSQINSVSEKVDASDAKNARQHILRFDDELSNGVCHSKDYFRQIIEDIHTYDEYCNNHPSFKNGYTEIASMHIKDTYNELWHEHRI